MNSNLYNVGILIFMADTGCECSLQRCLMSGLLALNIYFPGLLNLNLSMNAASPSGAASEPSVSAAAAQSAMRNNAAGDLMSGRAFDNGCVCHLESSYADMMNSLLRGASRSCNCLAPQLQPEMEFINALMNIGNKLGSLGTKEQKSEWVSQ